MRYTLESADHGWVDLTRESTSLSHYIALEQMRFSDGFQSVVEMDEGLMEDARIPPMMLQPLVEKRHLAWPQTKNAGWQYRLLREINLPHRPR